MTCEYSQRHLLDIKKKNLKKNKNKKYRTLVCRTIRKTAVYFWQRQKRNNEYKTTKQNLFDYPKTQRITADSKITEAKTTPTKLNFQLIQVRSILFFSLLDEQVNSFKR